MTGTKKKVQISEENGLVPPPASSVTKYIQQPCRSLVYPGFFPLDLESAVFQY